MGFIMENKPRYDPEKLFIENLDDTKSPAKRNQYNVDSNQQCLVLLNAASEMYLDNLFRMP